MVALLVGMGAWLLTFMQRKSLCRRFEDRFPERFCHLLARCPARPSMSALVVTITQATLWHALSAWAWKTALGIAPRWHAGNDPSGTAGRGGCDV
jgi:hypothetical protein